VREDVSFAVHSYNEAKALRLLLLSSLPLARNFSEWVVLDHRSDDETQQVLDDMEPVLLKAGIGLVRLFESRDLSAECTFADVRTQTVKAATRPVVALMDADFILGPAFATLLRRATKGLLKRQSTIHAYKYRIPVIWDYFATDEAGIVRDHGRVWRHSYSNRILHRDSVHYEQIGAGGRWEKLIHTPQRPEFYLLENNGDAILSVNVKPKDRVDLRYTMTYFMEDVMQGKLRGDWLENYNANRTRRMPDYPWDPKLNYRNAQSLLANVRLIEL
jgi:glycosyltransferase involved in cell wall biosynthesis